MLLFILSFYWETFTQNFETINLQEKASSQIKKDKPGQIKLTSLVKKAESKKIWENIKIPLAPPAIIGERKFIALTFDDGPNPKTTTKILNILQKEKVLATFFVLGRSANNYRNILAKIVENGHEIGSHGWTHKKLTTISYKEIANEMKKSNQLLQQFSQQRYKLFRPPYGSFNRQLIRLSGADFVVLWSVDPTDWKAKSEAKIVEKIMEEVGNGGIILLHDIKKITVKTLPKIIFELKKRNYHFLTVGNLLDLKQGRKQKVLRKVNL